MRVAGLAVLLVLLGVTPAAGAVTATVDGSTVTVEAGGERNRLRVAVVGAGRRTLRITDRRARVRAGRGCTAAGRREVRCTPRSRPLRLAVRAGAGNDNVRIVGRLRTEVSGGAGSNGLFGGSGPDRLLGGPERDVFRGAGGADVLVGGAGDDELFSGSGPDRLDGGDGRDVLAGSTGEDQLAGGAGNDFLSGGSRGDTLDGGPGFDQLTASGDFFRDRVRSCGAGRDSAGLDRADVLDPRAGCERVSRAGRRPTLRPHLVDPLATRPSRIGRVVAGVEGNRVTLVISCFDVDAPCAARIAVFAGDAGRPVTVLRGRLRCVRRSGFGVKRCDLARGRTRLTRAGRRLLAERGRLRARAVIHLEPGTRAGALPIRDRLTLTATTATQSR